ncbi:MAG: helix-turn-helix transcriptional regulator [Phycisphaeraceae bacterium]|nr:helix-turn-helix transcriptional regulator [Phycisphaeraceae bacterium]
MSIYVVLNLNGCVIQQGQTSMKQPWQPQNTISIQTLEINNRPIGTDWNAKNVCSSFWRLYVNNSEGAWIKLKNAKRYTLEKKRIYLIPAWVGFNCHNDQIIDHFYIHFDLLGLPGVLIRKLFTQPLELDSTRELTSLRRSLEAQPWLGTQNTLAIEYRIQSLLNLALSQAWDSLTHEQLDTCRMYLQGSHRFAETLQYIEEHLEHALHNAKLATFCHLSRDHFVRRFALEIGQTPAHYIRERRIAKAAKLLRFSDASVEQIAQQCGFTDRFHFSRVLANLTGTPPVAYRQGQHV